MLEIFILFIAGILAGLVNSIAGGGTFFTFPALMHSGLTSIIANATNSLSIFPGHFGGLIPQRKYLIGKIFELRYKILACFIGGALGSVLLMISSEKLFRSLIPFLLYLATILFYLAPKIQNILNENKKLLDRFSSQKASFIGLFLITIYGGYFGAGQGIMLMALLSITEKDDIKELNTQKNFFAVIANFTAVIFFAFSGMIAWKSALIVLIGAVIGGYIGAKIANSIKPQTLRKIIISVGFLLGTYYLLGL
ncbi:MAG: sulfite exporter TauE/SafE family protein [Rickettsiales bacterium]|nr:sulfite exporter TauE/SafE family protein [Rickettsiales bacterium]